MQKEAVVPKRSYGWEQLIIAIFSPAKVKDWDVLALSSQQVSQIVSKGLLALSLVSLWWWNWQLLLASSVGMGLMWLTYKMSQKQWRKLWQTGSGLITGYNRKLVFAVTSGSLGGFMTYLITAIWADTENRWLATGSILQGFGTLLTLILVGWQINRTNSDRHVVKFEQLLADLTASDSLKRLIAIRQLTNLVRHKSLDREHRLQLIEYFQFMLSQPQETHLQEALLDGLDLLGISAFSSSESVTVQTPLKLKHSVTENVL